jgi:hypothetical protein
MSNEDDKFEKYLRTFTGPALPTGSVSRAMSQVQRRRTMRRLLTVSGLIAAAVIVFFSFTTLKQHHPANSVIIPIATAKKRTVSVSNEVSMQSMMMALREGGSPALDVLLDSANKKLCPALKEEQL